MPYLQAGLTLLEIIVALFLLSVIFLSLARLDVLSLQIYYLAYQESVATSQIVSVIQRLKANYSRQSEEVVYWNEQNQKVLPRGKGEVVCNNTLCKIRLNWWYQGERSLSAAIKNPGIKNE